MFPPVSYELGSGPGPGPGPGPGGDAGPARAASAVPAAMAGPRRLLATGCPGSAAAMGPGTPGRVAAPLPASPTPFPPLFLHRYFALLRRTAAALDSKGRWGETVVDQKKNKPHNTPKSGVGSVRWKGGLPHASAKRVRRIRWPISFLSYNYRTACCIQKRLFFCQGHVSICPLVPSKCDRSPTGLEEILWVSAEQAWRFCCVE